MKAPRGPKCLPVIVSVSRPRVSRYDDGIVTVMMRGGVYDVIFSLRGDQIVNVVDTLHV
jgi:hypothetical protein